MPTDDRTQALLAQSAAWLNPVSSRVYSIQQADQFIRELSEALTAALAREATLEDRLKTLYDAEANGCCLFDGLLHPDASAHPDGRTRVMAFLRMWAHTYLLRGLPWDIPQTMGAALRHGIAILEEHDKAIESQLSEVARQLKEAQAREFKSLGK